MRTNQKAYFRRARQRPRALTYHLAHTHILTQHTIRVWRTAIVCQRDSTGMAYYIRNVHVRQLTCPIYERYERDFDTIALPHHHHAHRTYMQISVVNGWWVKNATLYAGWMMVRWTWTCATWRRTTTTTPTSHWRSGWGLLTCCVRIY